jgi:hypothetical protein
MKEVLINVALCLFVVINVDESMLWVVFIDGFFILRVIISSFREFIVIGQVREININFFWLIIFTSFHNALSVL